MRTLRTLLCVAGLCAGSAIVNAVPLAPTNMTATVSGNTIFLTWNAPPGPILGFYLAAGLTPGGIIAANLLAPNPAGPLNGFTAYPIPPGTYYLRTYAIDASGVGPPSNEVVAVVAAGGCAAPPGAPSGLSATVVGFFVSLSFAPAGGCPTLNYVLQAGSAPGLSNITSVNLGAATSLATLAPPGTYFVRVVAQNGNGNSSPSNEIVVTVGAGNVFFQR